LVEAGKDMKGILNPDEELEKIESEPGFKLPPNRV